MATRTQPATATPPTATTPTRRPDFGRLGTPPDAPSRSTLATWLLGASILLVAINMRSTTIALPPFMPTIRDDTGLSATATGFLTTIPVLCWGTLSLVAPRVARRIGFDWSIILTMAMLIAGVLLRILTPIWALFAGTLVIGIALSLGNVIVPASVKRDFPHKPGPMMSLYGLGMTLGGTLAAAIMMPIHLQTGLSWRNTLGLLAIPALIALVSLLPRLRMRSVLAANSALKQAEQANATRTRPRLWGDSLAWQISLFFGLQSTIFYGLGTWTPTILTERGMSESTAGLMWAFSQIGSIPASFVVPLLIQNGLPIRRIMLGICACFTTMILGMLFLPAVSPVLTALWMVLFGIAGTSAMACTLMLSIQRSPSTEYAAAMSGMSQAVGYAIAACSPFLFGMLHDLSGGWAAPIVVTLCLIPAIAWAGLGASRYRMLGQGAMADQRADHLVMASPDATGKTRAD